MKWLALLLALSATAYAGPQSDDDEDPLSKPAPRKQPTETKPEAKKPEPKKPEPKKPEAKKPEAKKPAEAKKKPAVDDDEDLPPPQKAKKPEAKKPEAKKPEPKAKKKPADDVDDDVPPPKAAKKPDPKAKKKSPVEDVVDVKPAKKHDEPKPKNAKKDDNKTAPVEIEMDEPASPKAAPPPVVVAPLDEPASPHPDEVAVTKTAPKREHGTKKWSFRAGVAYVDPLSTSNPLELSDVSGPASLAVQNGPIAGSGASVGTATIPAIIIGYKLPYPKLSLETVLGTPFTVKFEATGTLANMSLAPTALGIPTGVKPLGPDLGEAKAAPPLITLVYSPLQGGPVQPYLGAGAAVLIAYGAKVTNPILTEVSQPDMHVSPAPGLVLQTGIEAPLSHNIYARLDVKFIALMQANATVEHIQVKTPDLPLFDSVEVGTAKMSVMVNPLIIQAGIGMDF